MSEFTQRKNIRLKNYDYSLGGHYFITICTKDKKCLLGSVNQNVGAIINRPRESVKLSTYGKIVETAINEIPQHYEKIEIDKYVIMPNHIHMILIITVTGGRLIIAPTVSRIIKQLKSHITKQIGFPVFQRSFHDRIIRNEREYREIWQYIEYNPLNWLDDDYYT